MALRLALACLIALAGCMQGGLPPPATISLSGTVGGKALAARTVVPATIDGGDVGYFGVVISDDADLCAHLTASVRKAGSTELVLAVFFTGSKGAQPGTYDASGLFETIDASCQASSVQIDGTSTIQSFSPPQPAPGQPAELSGTFSLADKATGETLAGTFDATGCDEQFVMTTGLTCVP